MDEEERFEELRQALRQYDPLSIIREALHVLHTRIDRHEIGEWGGFYPWKVLLVIRWAAQVADAEGERRDVDETGFRQIYRMVQDIAPGLEIKGQQDQLGFADLMRRIIFPQLPFQVRTYDIKASLGRQLILFESLGTQPLRDMLGSFTTLSVREFLEVYYVYWVACVSEDALRVDIGYFNGIYPEATLVEFFRVLSLDVDGVQALIKSHTSPRASISYQANEHSPLAQKPFFRDGELVVPYSRRLLESTIRENLYDLFKARGGNAFTSRHFGPIFEAYVGMGLEFLDPPALRSERQIKALMRGDFKAPDFLVTEQDASIFIEAKCTELNPIARVLQGPESLSRNLASTVLKGLVQMNCAANILIDCGELPPRHALYGIVVTFKEHLIGEGTEFWESVAQAPVEAMLAETGVHAQIPPANLFVVSIDDFDYLVAGLRERGGTLSGLLQEIIARNADPETRAFMLSQHLESMWGQRYIPHYVEVATDELLAGIENRFPAEERLAHALGQVE